MNEAIDKFRVQLGTAIDPVEFVKKRSTGEYRNRQISSLNSDEELVAGQTAITTASCSFEGASTPADDLSVSGQQETNMSLDNTSHPGRPGLDELVPSRYALRVGEIDVLVVSDGVLSLPGAMLGHNADPAVRAARLEDMFLPPDVLEWALNVVVVRSGRRTILVDAGLGADPDLSLPRAGRLLQRLEAAGIDLASVTDVVLTHLHMDHIGGLLVDGVRDRLRPDLRIHLAAAEAEFWASPDFSRVSMPPGFPDALRRAAFRDGVRGGVGGAHPSHRRPHPRAQRGPPGVRRRPADVRRRRRVPGRVRAPRLVQRLRTRPRGGGPCPGPSFAGAGGEPRVAGGHSPVVPVGLPCGGRRRRLSLGTGPLGVLTACWVRARTRRPHAFEQLVDRCLVRHRPYLRPLRLRLCALDLGANSGTNMNANRISNVTSKTY
jgi:Metallo-beta-lactamase superfamily